MIHLMNKPFETDFGRQPVKVLAYDAKADRFVAAFSGDGTLFYSSQEDFTPPPPVPAAALSPKVGEIWVINGWAHLLIRKLHDSFYCLESSCSKVARYRVTGIDARPATPEEAEPFQELLEGLKASLGEE